MIRFLLTRLGASLVSASHAAGIVTAVSLFASGMAFGSQASGPSPSEPAFEVVSVKPTKIENGTWIWNGLTLVVPSVTVERMIILVYQRAPFQIVGGPDWMKKERFEIRAKALEVDLTKPMNALQQQEQVLPMLRNLLAERFALRVREETRALPRYVLRPRDEKRDRPRGMRPPDPACEKAHAAALQGAPPPSVASPAQQPCGIRIRTQVDKGLMTLSAGSTSMLELTGVLKGFLGRHIEDQSGIEGNFALELTIGTDQIPAFASPSANPTQRSGGPSIAEALADDFNLWLRSEEGPVPVVVVEHIERPSPN